MSSAAVLISRKPPAGMALGVLAGLGAGAFWGMAFVAPVMLPDHGSVDITVGRYLSCALVSILLMLWAGFRGQRVWPTWRQAWESLLLSLLGYTLYYLLLALAIQTTGAALPVLTIGTIPLWMMLLGKPEGLLWRKLVPGLILTVMGMSLMMYATASGMGAAGPDAQVWLGMFYAALAAASWVLFGLLNKRWLNRYPEVNSTMWASWAGIGAGIGALPIWWWLGSPLESMVARPDFGRYLVVCGVTGIGAAWIASVLWNMASRRLSASLAGQLIVSETVFGLFYGFVWSAHWPAAMQWLACALFVAGILASIKAHR